MLNCVRDSSASRKKAVDSTAAKVCTIVTRSNKGCKHSPSPAPESDMSESLAIGSDYEEGEFLEFYKIIIIVYDSGFW